MKFTTSIFLLTILIFSSCNSNMIFEKNVKMPENRWDFKNVVTLNPEITDTIVPYNIYINLRNAGGYQFSNIFIFLTTKTPSGKASRDTIELPLADESGKWLGDGMGDIWDNKLLFKKNFHFPEKGTYTFSMEQGMRIDPLPQIMDVGIGIEKAQ